MSDWLLEKAEEIFLNEMPVAPVYHWDMAYMMSDDLDNVKLTSIGDIVFESLSMMKKKAQQ